MTILNNMTFHIITLFPKAFSSYLGESILKRAIEDKKIKVKFYNPRDYVKNKHLRIDRKPYGGGPGMVIQAEPVIKAVEAALKESRIKNHELKKRGEKLQTTNYKLQTKIIWLSPSGKQFTNKYARKAAKQAADVIIICGRYEGIDARVKKVINSTPIYLPAIAKRRPWQAGEAGRMTRIKVEEMSVGPFVLTGGELPAMIMIDVISRQIPGILGDFTSLEEERVASPNVYTRPEVFEYKCKKYRVPKVLLSGHHKKIEEWKKKFVV